MADDIAALRQRVRELEEQLTRRVRLDETLSRTGARVRSLMSHAGDAIFIADASTGTLVDCNHRAEDLVGRSRAELLGCNHAVLHPTEEHARLTSEFQQAVAAGELEALTEGHVVHTDGSRRWVEIATSVHELDGRQLIQGIFRDTTRRHRAEIERAEAHDRCRVLASLLDLGVLVVRDTVVSANDAAHDLLGRDLVGSAPGGVLGSSAAWEDLRATCRNGVQHREWQAPSGTAFAVSAARIQHEGRDHLLVVTRPLG